MVLRSVVLAYIGPMPACFLCRQLCPGGSADDVFKLIRCQRVWLHPRPGDNPCASTDDACDARRVDWCVESTCLFVVFV